MVAVVSCSIRTRVALSPQQHTELNLKWDFGRSLMISSMTPARKIVTELELDFVVSTFPGTKNNQTQKSTLETTDRILVVNDGFPLQTT